VNRRRHLAVLAAAAVLLLLAVACGADDRTDGSAIAVSRSLEAGGAGTVFDTTISAFALPDRNLGADDQRAFVVGNTFFNDPWVIAPSSTEGRDGLGPTFNANSCSSCHFKDGRSAPPGPDDPDGPGLLMRLSVPGRGPHGEPVPEPTYGGQLNHRSIPGVPAEGRIVITYDEVEGRFDDGTPYTLQRPTYRIEAALGPLAADVAMSPRVAPALVGVGLLEAVPEATITARADPDDADGDGISGRPNQVWDAVAGRTVVGRFGWKANVATVEQQVAGAFVGDIGVTSRLQPEQNCPPAQAACQAAPDGGRPELDDHKLQRVTFYARTLAVPARRPTASGDLRRGAELFEEVGCASCHTPSTSTGRADIPELAEQDIQPFTDLLLHDMGPGLADGRPDFEASGNEWRTPPLWGVGLVEVVNGHTRFLHDGRARSLEEAVLWHGGEAEAAQRRYVGLTAADRAALLAFLGTL
jgi:CxxC motif-containing protein (DUF1111 family)